MPIIVSLERIFLFFQKTLLFGHIAAREKYFLPLDGTWRKVWPGSCLGR